jgi:hypothetical protein
MFDPFTLALIGAGVGAITNKKDPIKGAAMGGLLGYGGGVAGGALKGGAGNLVNGVGTNALAGGNIAQGAAMNASALAGSGLASGGGSAVAGTGIPMSAMSGGVGQAGITLPTVSASAPTSLSIAPEVVSQGAGITDLAQYANMSPDQLSIAKATDPSLLDKLKPYANIQNLQGAQSVASQFQSKAPSFGASGGGGMQRGQAPQGNEIQSLIQSVKIPERRRLSLI